MNHRNRIEGPSAKAARAGSAGLPLLAATAALALLAAYGLEPGRQACGQGFRMPSMPSPSRSFTPPTPRSFTPPPSRSFTPPTPRSFTPPTPQYQQRMQQSLKNFTNRSQQTMSRMQNDALRQHQRTQDRITIQQQQQRVRDYSRTQAARNHAAQAAAIQARKYRPVVPDGTWDNTPAWQQPQPAAPLIQVSTGDTVVTTARAPLKRGTTPLLMVDADTQLYVTGVRGDWAGLHVWQNGQKYSGWIHRKYLKPAYAFAPAAPAAFWEPVPAAPAETLAEPTRYALVTFHNPSGRVIEYEWRWNEQDPWQNSTIRPGEEWLHSYPLASQSSEATPDLQIKFDTDATFTIDRRTYHVRAATGQNKEAGAGMLYHFFSEDNGARIVLE